MPEPSGPRAIEGVESEIELLRALIDGVAAGLNTHSKLAEKLSVLEAVGHAAPQLARMLKTQRELATGDLDPAALLREALLELQEEWPEFKLFCTEFKPQKEETVAPES